jgi:hypothetical protein
MFPPQLPQCGYIGRCFCYFDEDELVEVEVEVEKEVIS